MSGQFCSHCGQKAEEVRRPFYRLLKDWVNKLCELDGRAYVTLYYLLTRPAFLTKEYVSGRRASYTHPLRLFLVISILFYVAFALGSSFQSIRESMSATPENVQTDSVVADSSDSTEPSFQISFGIGDEPDADDAETTEDAENAEVAGDAGDTENAGDTDSTEGDIDDLIEFMIDSVDQFSLPFLSAPNNENLRNIIRNLGRSNMRELRQNPEDFLNDLFLNALESLAALLLLLMIPMLALIQKVAFFTSRKYYIEHMMLTLHNHSFLLLAVMMRVITITVANQEVPVLSSISRLASIALVFWVIIYLYLSLKNYYGGGHFLTGIRFLIISVLYFIITVVSSTTLYLLLFLFT